MTTSLWQAPKKPLADKLAEIYQKFVTENKLEKAAQAQDFSELFQKFTPPLSQTKLAGISELMLKDFTDAFGLAAVGFIQQVQTLLANEVKDFAATNRFILEAYVKLAEWAKININNEMAGSYFVLKAADELNAFMLQYQGLQFAFDNQLEEKVKQVGVTICRTKVFEHKNAEAQRKNFTDFFETRIFPKELLHWLADNSKNPIFTWAVQRGWGDLTAEKFAREVTAEMIVFSINIKEPLAANPPLQNAVAAIAEKLGFKGYEATAKDFMEQFNKQMVPLDKIENRK